MRKLKWSQIYPLVVIFAMYVVYQYRENNKEEVASAKQKTEENRVVIKGMTMGVTYTIVYYDTVNRKIKHAVDSLLVDFNNHLSTYIPTSEISEFNRTNNLDSLSPYMYRVLRRSEEIYELSNGGFDPTVMPLVNLWGFGYKKNKTLPDTSLIDSVKRFVGFDKVLFDRNTLVSPPNMELGFGAIAKGYGVDLVGDLLVRKGIKSFLIEIGGENLAKGIKPNGKGWVLGVLYPEKAKALENIYYCGVVLENKAMATSGPYIQQKMINGIKYSHTIDPRTGFPVEQSLLSISILADDCITADAVATAINVMSVDEAKLFLEAHAEYDGLLLYQSGDEIEEFKTIGFSTVDVNG